jgi:hypothetical protein
MNLKVAVKLNHDANENGRKQLVDFAGLADQETIGKFISSLFTEIDAQNAITALGGTSLGKASIVLRLH